MVVGQNFSFSTQLKKTGKSARVHAPPKSLRDRRFLVESTKWTEKSK